MNIFVFSDESGVFDKEHNDIFVFGGLIFLSKEEKDIQSRKYSSVEKNIRRQRILKNDNEIIGELKANLISNSEKSKLFRSLNACTKFCGIVNQKSVLSNIFQGKKDKQRYLDYVYKISVKQALKKLITSNKIHPDEVENIYFCVDEHTTATNGKYELREGLEQELKYGTYNNNYQYFFPPLFTKIKNINLEFCNSEKKILIRASDIIANRVFYLSRTNKEKLLDVQNLYIAEFP